MNIFQGGVHHTTLGSASVRKGVRKGCLVYGKGGTNAQHLPENNEPQKRWRLFEAHWQCPLVSDRTVVVATTSSIGIAVTLGVPVRQVHCRWVRISVFRVGVHEFYRWGRAMPNSRTSVIETLTPPRNRVKKPIVFSSRNDLSNTYRNCQHKRQGVKPRGKSNGLWK